MGVFEYFDQDTESIVYLVVPSPESQNEESTILSESESTASGSTICSEDAADYFILHHGRPQFAGDNIARWLPSDNIRRYVVQYLVARWLIGGDYAGPVREILAPVRGVERHVLELGTKTGTWTQSMAATFPHVQFRSVDLAPVIPHVPRPNVVFEVYDFTEGLLLEDNSFDIVFVHFLSGGVKNYRDLLREVHRVLRPGGLIHTVDFNIQLWDPDDLSITATRTTPVTCYFVNLIRERLTKSGIDPDTCTKVAGWLAPGSDLWENEASHQQGFQEIQQLVGATPYYPHEGFPCSQRMDLMTMSFQIHFATMLLRDLHSLLMDQPMTEQEAQRLTDDSLAELKQPDGCAIFKLYCTYARKI